MQSVEQRLADIGLGHRPDAASYLDGKHVVFRIASGEELGRFDVFDAIHLAETEG